MILGTGIDIVSVQRVHELIARSGGRFVRRWFSEEEAAYCSSKAHPSRHFAARIAGKEAVIKAFGPAWEAGILLRDIEIVASESGAPSVRLLGRARMIAERLGAAAVHVSLSHCDQYAVASVVVSGPGRDSAR
jgi:holo-[acyl-carrier protein] synthase